jgi:hypothetical protein
MRSYLKLVLVLSLFTLAFGFFEWEQRGDWQGLLIGGGIGMFLGCCSGAASGASSLTCSTR